MPLCLPPLHPSSPIRSLHRQLTQYIRMGSCFSTSKTFSGEGRTLNEPSTSSQPHNKDSGNSGGRRLGGDPSQPPSAVIAAASSSPGTTTDADREARAKAAERRMNQQAAKGAPASGKLSKQLEQQKATNPHNLGDQNEPERVVVSISLSPHSQNWEGEKLTPTFVPTFSQWD